MYFRQLVVDSANSLINLVSQDFKRQYPICRRLCSAFIWKSIQIWRNPFPFKCLQNHDYVIDPRKVNLKECILISIILRSIDSLFYRYILRPSSFESSSGAQWMRSKTSFFFKKSYEHHLIHRNVCFHTKSTMNSTVLCRLFSLLKYPSIDIFRACFIVTKWSKLTFSRIQSKSFRYVRVTCLKFGLHPLWIIWSTVELSSKR